MLAPEISNYIDAHSNADDPTMIEIERSTHLHTLAPQMLSGRIQGRFLTLITSLLNAKNVLEIGTFTGYGSICLAKGLGSEGRVVTIETNPEYSHLIKKHITMAGIHNNIEVVFGDALKIIPQRKEIWDIVYIDANKQEYIEYYNAVIDSVRPGGIILSDNVLWSGKVVYEPEDPDARVIDQYNKMLKNDPRVDVLMLPIRDGLSLARKG